MLLPRATQKTRYNMVFICTTPERRKPQNTKRQRDKAAKGKCLFGGHSPTSGMVKSQGL